MRVRVTNFDENGQVQAARDIYDASVQNILRRKEVRKDISEASRTEIVITKE